MVELFPFNYVPLFNFRSPRLLPSTFPAPAVMQLPELLLSDARLETPPGAPRFKSELPAPLRREYAAPVLIFFKAAASSCAEQIEPGRKSNYGQRLERIGSIFKIR